ncbi:hypothetical protein KL86SPO_30997 [uncultured Sporomusa sp.]|uniref:Uncharacterized protein n=1 Tax=uncultured Sporomusa sp. TaxID=307249 RepID=A0A212LTU1_9FIRM|nr:hypothetical protein KL86SPO_30997 [uncultured Sporomusa sp.]
MVRPPARNTILWKTEKWIEGQKKLHKGGEFKEKYVNSAIEINKKTQTKKGV